MLTNVRDPLRVRVAGYIFPVEPILVGWLMLVAGEQRERHLAFCFHVPADHLLPEAFWTSHSRNGAPEVFDGRVDDQQQIKLRTFARPYASHPSNTACGVEARVLLSVEGCCHPSCELACDASVFTHADRRQCSHT